MYFKHNESAGWGDTMHWRYLDFRISNNCSQTACDTAFYLRLTVAGRHCISPKD